MISRPLVSATGAFIAAAIAIPPIRSLAQRRGLYDRPGTLKPHRQPTPRLGGAAMGIGVAVGVLLSANAMQMRDWIAIAVVLSVWGMGLVDDLWNLTPSVRLASELLAGAVLWSAGWRTDWFSAPVLDLVATCLLFAFLINAVNMLDGADGLAAGVIGVGAVGLAIARGETISGSILALCLVAVCAAILIYNFPPASIFMGDSGSALIGAMAGLLILQRNSGAGGRNEALPLLIFFLLPLGDAGLAIVRRLRTRHSPFRGDRRHYYDLLLQRGWPLRRVLAISYGLAAILVSAGLLCESGRASAFALIGAIAAALLVVAWVLGSFIPDQAAPKPQGAKLLPKIEA